MADSNRSPEKRVYVGPGMYWEEIVNKDHPTSKNPTLDEVLLRLSERFTSGNIIPVERAHLTRDEGAVLMTAIADLRKPPPQPMTQARSPGETRVDVLTNEQCDRIIAELQAQEWTGISRDDVRLWDGLITSMRLESSPKASGEPT